jgi:HEPN domain-containing protein
VKQAFGFAKQAEIFLERGDYNLALKTSNTSDETFETTVIQLSGGIIQ